MNTIILENSSEADFNDVLIGDWIVIKNRLHIKITDGTILDILSKATKPVDGKERIKVLKAIAIRVP